MSVASSSDDALASPCRWCASPLQRRRQEFCGRKCRQSAFRARRGRGHKPSSVDGRQRPAGALFVYADPPYPGLSKRYYGNEPTYAGEVDHPALIASLERRRQTGEIAGYALSTSKRGLREYLHLFPDEADFAPWVKPTGVRPAAYGVHNKHEYVIFVAGRSLRPAVRDFLCAMPARGEGSLPGRKPRRFCTWLFDLLGMVPGDRLEDMFPGTGIVGRLWAEVSAAAAANDGASSLAKAHNDGMSERRLFSPASVTEQGDDEERAGVVLDVGDSDSAGGAAL